jgi:hypothetical protein
LVYSWERKRIFVTYLVETCIVDAHPKLPIALQDDHRIGQPPGVVDLLYEANIEQLLDFFTDEVFHSTDCFQGLCWTNLASG